MAFEPASESDLLEIFRREVSPEYAAGLETENDGVGFDAVVAFAAMDARVTEAGAVSTQAYYLLPHSTQIRPESQGEERATLTLFLSRIAPVDFDMVLDMGTAGPSVVESVRAGDGTLTEQHTYDLETETTLPSGSLGPFALTYRARRPGYQGNFPWPDVPGREVSFVERGRAAVPGATFLAGNVIEDVPGVPDRFAQFMVGQFIRVTSGPNAAITPRRIISFTPPQTSGGPSSVIVDGAPLTPGVGDVEVEEYEDVGLRITGLTMAVGGRHGWLDALGVERGIYRQASETDAALRERIATLDDVVSPTAISRLCQRILTPAGIPWRIIEAGDPDVLTAFRWQLGAVGTGAVDLVTIDFATRRRMFAVVLGVTGAGENGTMYDVVYGATDENDLDGDASCDGGPQEWLATLAALRAQLDRIRAGGVAAPILLDPAYW